MPQVADMKTWAIQAEDAPAHIGRLPASAVLREGVIGVGAGSFRVAQDTGANMVIKVGSGAVGDLVAIAGESAGQGIYVAEHQAGTQNLSIAASDPTNDRIDLVIARVYDDEADSSGNNYADIEVVQGTPAGSPAVPALPGGAVPLAQILVNNAVTAITNSDITDLRAEAPTRGALYTTVRFTASGSFVKANYPWLRAVRVRLVGGGGGGGGAALTGRSGGGGGGGGYAEAMLAASALAASVTVTVGAGGTVSAGDTDGGAGGTTSFGAHVVATGGGGGGMGSDPHGGVPGVGTTGDFLTSGQGGMPTNIGAAGQGSGLGGGSLLGGGAEGRKPGTTAAGADAQGYGGGGSGAYRNTDGGSAGGLGKAGVVIVELFA